MCVHAHRSLTVLHFVMGCVLQFGELAHKRVHYYYYYYYYYYYTRCTVFVCPSVFPCELLGFMLFVSRLTYTPHRAVM